jgi:hypothetical protein
VADDVSTGELARRLDQVLQIVQTLVSRPEYSSDQRHHESRFTEIGRRIDDVERDIADERSARKEGDRVLHERMDKTGSNWRTNLWQGLAAVLILVGIAVNIWTATRGR